MKISREERRKREAEKKNSECKKNRKFSSSLFSSSSREREKGEKGEKERRRLFINMRFLQSRKRVVYWTNLINLLKGNRKKRPSVARKVLRLDELFYTYF